MRLRQETGLGIGAILAIHLLVSMLAIALLSRMGPAIERILQENVYSEEAVEAMLALLIVTPEGEVPEAFHKALRRAQDNVTEEAERPLLLAISQREQRAFAGDPLERRALVSALQQLGQVNRDSMYQADQKAKRLGQAGAWAATMLGTLALLLGIFVYRRLRLRMELPIEELRRTTQSVREGNLQARCASGDGPLELRQLATDLNWVLDHWGPEEHQAPSPDAREDELRRLLVWLLDRDSSPTLILDADNSRVSANREGLLLDGPAPDQDGAWTLEEIPNTSLRIATRRSGADPDDNADPESTIALDPEVDSDADAT